jgi:hypothetical protein
MDETLFRVVVFTDAPGMKLPTDFPDGLLAIPFGKGCLLLLTPQEVTAGIRRGKWWKRRQAMLQREADAVPPETPRVSRRRRRS